MAPKQKTTQMSVHFPPGLNGERLRTQCKAVIGISLPTPGRSLIGSAFITEQSLKALLHKSQRLFYERILVLGDLIQKHNVRLIHPEYDETKCEEEAEKIGDEWDKSNAKFLSGLQPPIVRWRVLLADSGLKTEADGIYNFYDDPSSEGVKFKRVVDETATKFADRYCKGEADANSEIYTRVKVSSIKYIREELAYLFAYAIKNKINYFLYPGDETDCPAFTAAREIFLTGENKNLFQWMKITLREHVQKPKLKRKLVGREVEGGEEMAKLRQDVEKLKAANSEMKERFDRICALLIAVTQAPTMLPLSEAGTLLAQALESGVKVPSEVRSAAGFSYAQDRVRPSERVLHQASTSDLELPSPAVGFGQQTMNGVL